MKKDKNTSKTGKKNNEAQKITRKQALQKAGLLSLTTASMLLLMKSPAKAQASPPPPTDW